MEGTPYTFSQKLLMIVASVFVATLAYVACQQEAELDDSHVSEDYVYAPLR